MRALRYSIEEGLASVWRNRDASLLATATIAIAMAALGALLLVTRTAGTMLAEWGSSAEMSVFLDDDVGAAERAAVELLLIKSELVEGVDYLTKRQALERFREEFNELTAMAEPLAEENPFPASFEVRLRPDAGTTAGAEALAAQLAGTAGVVDVRYDRVWLERLSRALDLLRGLGLLVVLVLGAGAALTVVSVVRLACHARREEIEIMQLVGAPIAYIRGPFVMEGVIEGGTGALVALAGLWVGFTYLRAEYGPAAAEVLGIADLTFLPASVWGALVLGGVFVGCLGGLVGAVTATGHEDR